MIFKNGEQMKKAIDIITTTILLVILLILIFCYSQLKVFHKDYINFCGYTIFQVITGSMSPTIKEQDIVIVKLTDDVKVDDIITFRMGDDFVTHRVIGIEDGKIITRGDANNSQDAPISEEEIVGKVVFIISNVAVWIKVIKEPIVIAAIIFTIIAMKIMFSQKNK